MADFTISSLRGGLDDSSASTSLADDACTVAENVEFVRSMLGERRRGCDNLTDLPSYLTDRAAITWMYWHTPTNDAGDAILFVLAQDLITPFAAQFAYRGASGWVQISSVDTFDSTPPYGYHIRAVSLHGKMFITYTSSADRLHVWEEGDTSFRRVGIAEPAAAPSVANTGAGSYAGTRYIRVRWATLSGSTVLMRSEPTDATTFAPSGAGASARVTRPTLTGIDAEVTHWEIEASLDNANFYRIGRESTVTTTFDDSTAFATGYAAAGVLSEDIGDYTLLESGALLTADEDRLIMGGSAWANPERAARIVWTPAGGVGDGSVGRPGVGNDERTELDTDPFIDLDGDEGGGLTGLSRVVNGHFYAFKYGAIYKFVRTGHRDKPYDAFPVTKSLGALPGSLVEAVDQAGQPAQYFLDPKQGPYRFGPNGLQWCGRDIRTFWRTVNVNATVPCHGIYYPASNQIHWWVATGANNTPNAKIIVHVNEMRLTDEGVRRGWVTVPDGDVIAGAHCSVMAASNVESSSARGIDLVPYIGIAHATDLILKCDTGTTDNGTTYEGRVMSKPYLLSGLLSQHGVRAGTLMAKADAGETVYVRVRRDFGLETKRVSTSIAPSGSEEHVIKPLDDLSMSEARAMQVEFGDLGDGAPANAWELNGFAMKTNRGQGD